MSQRTQVTHLENRWQLYLNGKSGFISMIKAVVDGLKVPGEGSRRL